jgi:hypothetical protein
VRRSRLRLRPGLERRTVERRLAVAREREKRRGSGADWRGSAASCCVDVCAHRRLTSLRRSGGLALVAVHGGPRALAPAGGHHVELPWQLELQARVLAFQLVIRVPEPPTSLVPFTCCALFTVVDE